MKFNTSLFIVVVLFSKLNAQNCDSLRSYIKSSFVVSEKKCEHLNILQATYDTLSQNIELNRTEACSELLNILVSAINQKLVEQEFAYCDFSLKHAKQLLLAKDSIIAFEYYYKVYGFGLNFTSAGKLHKEMENNRKKYFEYFIAGGIGMLDCYRNNKKRLEELNPYIFINAELSKYYEEALRQVGLEPKY